MPRNGVRTVSPGLLHRSMHRSITSSCSGEIWRSSSLSRPPRYCSVRDWFMSIQTGDAYRCQTSIEYQLRPSVDVVNFDRSGPSPSPCHSLNHPLTSSEEHTSELQSLLRHSYAVLGLNKTTYAQSHTPSRTHTANN